MSQENLAFSQSYECFIFSLIYCPHLYVWQCVEVVSGKKLFHTPESERVNFGVLENQSEAWESPGKLFVKKGTNQLRKRFKLFTIVLLYLRGSYITSSVVI